MSNAISADIKGSPLVTEIMKLTRRGLTDRQIGRLLDKHYKTIAYHRSRYGIVSGRSYKAALSEQRRTQTVNKRTYKMLLNDSASQQPKTKIKHGLNAYAPITCRGENCPYRETCDIPDSDLEVGESCLTEGAFIADLFERYCRELRIDEDDIAGLARIRNLIDVEIKLMRCNRLTAINPGLIQTIWEGEQPRRRLNPIARYDLLLMRERSKVLSCLR